MCKLRLQLNEKDPKIYESMVKKCLKKLKLITTYTINI